MTAVLTMRLDEEEIAVVNSADVPCELLPSRKIGPGANVEFIDGEGGIHNHSMGELAGWAHFSLRVHPNLACQADCALTDSEVYNPEVFAAGKGQGVRFQPFFLPGANVDLGQFRGQGLFRRGLHFSGTITPGWVRLSCECDECRQSFQIQSFHAGFGNAGYMYSASGLYTIIIDGTEPGAPPALGEADPETTAELEGRLPLAPDGTRFGLWESFRCPHCGAPYIDYRAHPELREAEYYGNYHIGMEPLKFPLVGDPGDDISN